MTQCAGTFPKARGLLTRVAPAAGFLLLALLFTYPLGARLREAYLASNELEFFLWRYWWMKMLMKGFLEAPASPLVNLWNFLYYGILGTQQFPEAGNLVDEMALSLPLEAIFGAPLFYNLKALLLLTLNGMCGYWLVHYLTRSRLAAFLGGVLLTYNAFVVHMFMIGRMREGFLGFMALFILYLFKTFREDGRHARAAGLCLGLASLFYWFYGFFLLFFTAFFLVYFLLAERKTAAPGAPLWKRGLLVLLLFLAVAYPFAHPYVALIVKREPVGKDLALWPSFPALKQVWGPPPQESGSPAISHEAYQLILRESHTLSWPFTATATLLVVFAFFAGRRVAWLYGLTLLAGFTLALGPYLRLARDTYLEFPLAPYHALFTYLPLFSRFQRPDRFLSLAVLAVAVLASMGLAWLMFRTRTSRLQRLMLTGLVLVFSVLELGAAGTLPMQSHRLVIPEFYRQIAKEERIGVLEVPLGAYYDNINFYQSVHRKRIFEPWIRGVYPQDVPLSDEVLWLASREDLWYNTYLQHLKSISVPGGEEEPYVREHVDDLIARKFRYVVLHQANCLAMKDGLKVYRRLQKDLEKTFGRPVAYDQENILFASLPLPREALFEMRVYRIR